MQSSATELHLTWAPPSDPNGVITAYFVTWRKVKDDKNNSVVGVLKQDKLQASARSLSIKNLGE